MLFGSPHGKAVSNMQSEPFLLVFMLLALHRLTVHCRRLAGSFLLTACGSWKTAVHVPFLPCLLQAEKAQVPQPLF